MIAGITIVKDEADIIEGVVEHMLAEVDHVVVGDNLSTDATPEILRGLSERYDDRLTVYCDEEVAYMQSAKMTALAQVAADAGAEWVVPFDADEWWYSPFGRIGDILEGIPGQYLTASAALYDHVATGADPDNLSPLYRMGWRRRLPGPLPKVACRTRADLVIEQGNHAARYEGHTTCLTGQLVVRHFPFRSAEQMTRKAINGAAAYAATDLPLDVGAHWRQYGALIDAHGPDALHPVFREWFFVEQPEADEALIFDPVWGIHA